MQQRFETFTVLISGINRNIRRIKTEEMEEFDLKSHHVSCIYYLYMQDGLTARELCDLCEEDKANISRALDFLEKQGYTVLRYTNTDVDHQFFAVCEDILKCLPPRGGRWHGVSRDG